MRRMLRLLALFAPATLAACTSVGTPPQPIPRAEIVVEQAPVPADIRPLTEDQRAMLDG